MPEVNFDGLVGPTHHYGGLAYGNVASMRHASQVSNPKAAALQGLEKMKILHDLGLIQGVLPPHPRPHIPTLRGYGFTGSDAEVIEKAFQADPELFYRCCSSAFMWTANAATVTPSTDCADGEVHFTAANLKGQLHRSLESEVTQEHLKKVFSSGCFVHHNPVVSEDEGAANHTRFCRDEDSVGVHLFVYGKGGKGPEPMEFPARQDLKASREIVKQHQIHEARVTYAQQNPKAIDAGVFHNDVIAVGHGNFFLYHEEAFIDTKKTIDDLDTKLELQCGIPLIPLCVPANRLNLKAAVSTYLFNSQIVTLPDGTMAIIAPQDCAHDPDTHDFLHEMAETPEIPIKRILYCNLDESMRNGGGPACLRLRVVLSDEELKKVHPGVIMTEQLYQRLKAWIHTHYRDHLRPTDLVDPGLHAEAQEALKQLDTLLFANRS